MNHQYTRTYGRTKVRGMNISIMDSNPHLFSTIPSDIVKKTSWDSVHLEIGFGNGENLIHRSMIDSNSLQIGIEVYKNGICKVLKHIQDKFMKNIILFSMDARDFIKNIHSIEVNYIYIMFPDPWHKKSEKKRQKKRLVNKEFLLNILQILKPNGYLIFASDHKDYYDNIKVYLEELINLQQITIENETINQYPDIFQKDYFIQSNYEKKATNNRHYIVYKKV